MKELFFDAVAGHPKVAPALMHQAWNTLRPFTLFLGQAIHTARERQTRYQLPWERVRNLVTIRLEPVDTLLRVPRRAPGVVLTDWPADLAPDLGQQGFVINRGVGLCVHEAWRVPTGMRVATDVPVDVTDRVIWCGVTSAVQREPPSPAPEVVAALDGRPVRLVGGARLDPGERHWLLLLEGEHHDGPMIVDGEENAENMRLYGISQAFVEEVCRAQHCPRGEVLLLLCNDARETLLIPREPQKWHRVPGKQAQAGRTRAGRCTNGAGKGKKAPAQPENDAPKQPGKQVRR